MTLDNSKSFFLEYLKNEKRYSLHTVYSYQNDIEGFLKYMVQYDINSVLKIHNSLVRDWLIFLKEQNYSSRSIHRKRSAIQSWFKFLVIKEYIPKIPFEDIMVPKIEKRLPIFASQKEMYQLFNNITFPDDFQGETHRMILLFFYYTGVRVSELVHIKLQDIDFGKSLVKIDFGKGNKSRFIPLSSIFQEELKRYIKKRENFYYDKLKTDYLFLTEKDNQFNRSSIYLIVKKYLGASTTLDKTCPHVLRHTFATHLLEEGADINAIKEFLGHSSLASTQVYTHLNIKKLKEVYKKAHPKK
ncbi:MAG: tyrosine-type recombinase/integrase [Chitinophagaceae bacterium]